MSSHDDHVKGYRELTDSQEMILALLPIPSALLSVVGSLVVITMAFKSHRSKPWSPYHGLITAMSICAVLSALTAASSSFLYPKETSNFVWAFGNDATCTGIAFMNQFSTSGLLYQSMLAIYFVLKTKYGLYNDYITYKYEPMMHYFALGYPLVSAYAGLFFDAYGERQGSLGCSVRTCPFDSEGNRLECNFPVVDWFLGRAVYQFIFVSVTGCFIIIYLFVQKKMKLQEERTSSRNRHFYSSDWGENVFDVSNRLDLAHDKRVREAQMKAKHKKQLRLVLRQADLYIGGVIFCNLATISIRFIVGDYDHGESFNDEMQIPHDYYILMVFQAILFPLQGFVNMLVYMKPQYYKNRTDFPDESRWWVFQRCVCGDDIEPTTGVVNMEAVSGKTTSTPARSQGEGEVLTEKSLPGASDQSSSIKETERQCNAGAKVEEIRPKALQKKIQVHSSPSSTTILMDGSLQTTPITIMGDDI